MTGKAPTLLKTKGLVKVKPLVEGGKTRGFEIEHRDGRQTAVVRPETVRYRLSVNREP